MINKKIEVGSLVRAENFPENHYNNMIVLELKMVGHDNDVCTVYRGDGQKDYFYVTTLILL